MTVFIGENIRKLRRENNLTQEEIAEALGVSFQSVSRWERGESYPDITLLPEIASYFEVTVDELLGTNKALNENKINDYIKLYDTMKLKDIAFTFGAFQKASKEFPCDFRIQIRYMQLLQEYRIFSNSTEIIKNSSWIKPSEEIHKIYDRIQKNCTDDSIRIWSKTVMISHLLWKYDCICDEKGNFHVYDEYLEKAKEIVETLPSMCNSREIMAIADKDNWHQIKKDTLEEILYLLHNEIYGYCINYSCDEQIKQYEALQTLLELVYPDRIYCKNSFNRLYNYGHLGHLYHQNGNDIKALEHLKKASLYAKELDNAPDNSEQAKRFYNYGTAYRELTACEFIKAVMTEHYPLSEEFKETNEFKEIIEKLDISKM